jgi:SET domain-containing protein
MAASSIDSRYAPFRLLVRQSRIHGWGVFAAQRIPRGRKVIEYAGERITFAEARRRWSPRRNYLFAPADGIFIDGAAGGSGAQYVNHSCAPNLHARFLRDHLLFFSSRVIEKGEELTLDYKYAGGGSQKHHCRCNAPTCRGTMIKARRDAQTRRATRRSVTG